MKNLFIIGNGFDLNLGYKTGYSDFMASEQFEALIADENKLCIHLKEQENLCNWVDIEAELIEYSELYDPENKDRKSFRLEYYALRDALCDYINAIDLTQIDQNSYLGQIIIRPECNSNETVILDFNYTDSVRELIMHTDPNGMQHCEIINVHGLAKNRDIIFGVQESASKNPADIWLLKIVDRNYKQIDIYEDYLVEAENIHFFGFSLGVSDHSYFTYFFRNYGIDHSNKPKKTLFLPFYKEEGRLDLNKQIFALSDGHITKTRKTFNLHFVDIIEEEKKSNNQTRR